MRTLTLYDGAQITSSTLYALTFEHRHDPYKHQSCIILTRGKPTNSSAPGPSSLGPTNPSAFQRPRPISTSKASAVTNSRGRRRLFPLSPVRRRTAAPTPPAVPAG